MSVLSRPEMLKHLKVGNIVIDPFEKANLSSASYDVRLGKYFYRQARIKHSQILNPFYAKSVKKMYPKYEEAILIKQAKSEINPFHDLSSKDSIILITPGETILAHTIEFIGGRNGTKDLPAIVTEMRARSSVGRIGIGVCKCAGWGDIDYVNRWTMEITNWSSATIPLPVGFRIAQIIFHTTTQVDRKDIYSKKGKYQQKLNLDKTKKSWKPEDMLPKLYLDRDLKNFRKYSK